VENWDGAVGTFSDVAAAADAVVLALKGGVATARVSGTIGLPTLAVT